MANSGGIPETVILDANDGGVARLQSREFDTAGLRVALNIIEKGEQRLANANPVAESDQICQP
ncbi:hypothetical protein BRDID11002_12670 [Bradyrhizobium diazoefficiens]